MATPELTLRDVAQRAGVSVAAVSQAINGTGALSAATRSRIKTIAEELGYTPNKSASALRRGRTMSIAFVVSATETAESERRWAQLYAGQLKALMTVAAGARFTVTVIPADQPGFLRDAQVDAVYLPEAREGDPLIAEAVRLGLAIVTNELRLDYPRSISLRLGFEAASRSALELLRAGGATRIGLLIEEPGFVNQTLGEASYRAWCAENTQTPIIATVDFARTTLEARLAELLQQGVDAVFSFAENGPALFIMLERAGIVVPRDVQLVSLCIDECEVNARLGLSHVCVRPGVAPALVIEALLQLIDSEPIGQRVFDAPYVLHRGTTTRAASQ